MSDPDKTFWEGCHVVGGCNALHRENDKLCKAEAAIAELLAALKRIELFDSLDYGMHIRGVQQIAKEAIAKAES